MNKLSLLLFGALLASQVAIAQTDSLSTFFDDDEYRHKFHVKLNLTDAINGDYNLALEFLPFNRTSLQVSYGILTDAYLWEGEISDQGGIFRDVVDDLAIDGGYSFSGKIRWYFPTNALEGIYSSIGYRQRSYSLETQDEPYHIRDYVMQLGVKLPIAKPHLFLDAGIMYGARRRSNGAYDGFFDGTSSYIVQPNIQISYGF